MRVLLQCCLRSGSSWYQFLHTDYLSQGVLLGVPSPETHLLDHRSRARGIMLLIYLPSQPGFYQVFYAGKVTRFVKDFYQIFPTWIAAESVKSSLFKRPARQVLFIVEFVFGVTDTLSFA